MQIIDLLCNGCRRIRPVYADGYKDKHCLEEMFSNYDFQSSDHLIIDFVLPMLRENLVLFGGCPGCIASVEHASMG